MTFIIIGIIGAAGLIGFVSYRIGTFNGYKRGLIYASTEITTKVLCKNDPEKAAQITALFGPMIEGKIKCETKA
jgi:hypothetical protein